MEKLNGASQIFQELPSVRYGSITSLIQFSECWSSLNVPWMGRARTNGRSNRSNDLLHNNFFSFDACTSVALCPQNAMYVAPLEPCRMAACCTPSWGRSATEKTQEQCGPSRVGCWAEYWAETKDQKWGRGRGLVNGESQFLKSGYKLRPGPAPRLTYCTNGSLPPPPRAESISEFGGWPRALSVKAA